jgi:hypothetical protein
MDTGEASVSPPVKEINTSYSPMYAFSGAAAVTAVTDKAKG